MTIDHAAVYVPMDKLQEVLDWYLTALKPLGYEKLAEFGNDKEVIGIGANKQADWWIVGTKQTIGVKSHVAFRADDRKAVDEYHAAATKAGGECNGKPGLRAHYHPAYYGAFVRDPVGNNIEVVCHKPE